MDYKSRSKKLSWLLRHDPDYPFTKGGWRSVDDLCRKHGFTADEIATIVAENDKRRFELSNDGSQVRALYGHSVRIDFDMAQTPPPAALYHGTSENALASILSEGINARTRQWVHLCPSIDIARQVGSRHGVPVVLTIDTSSMLADGYTFYNPNPITWLVSDIPPKYINIDKG